MDHWNIEKILQDYEHKEQEVLYVIYNNEKCNMSKFKTFINEYDHTNDDRGYHIDAFYNTMIVGTDWWLHYINICCSDPHWVYYKHPGKN